MEFTESNTKLVGARKRKPVNISKISATPSPPSTLNEEENDAGTSPCSSTMSLDRPPSAEPNNNKIQSILSELKFAKQRNAPPISQLKRVVSPPLRASLFTNHFTGGGLLEEKPFNNGHPLLVPNVAHAHQQTTRTPIQLQDEPLDLSVDAVDLRKGPSWYGNMVVKNGPTTQSPPTRHSLIPSPPPSPPTNAPMDLTRSTVATRPSPPSIKKEDLHVSSSFGSPPSSIGSNAAVDHEHQQRIVRKYQKRKDSVAAPPPPQTPTVPGVKPKQRRYRTERPFHCPHCPARFTLRSNMERHGKHQHASVWQRSPSNRVLNKQRALLQQQQGSPSATTSPQTPPSPPPSNIRMVLSQQLKRKLSSIESADLASVETLLEKTGNEDFKKYFRSVAGDDYEEDDEEQGAIDEYDDERFREDYYEDEDEEEETPPTSNVGRRSSLRSNNNNKVAPASASGGGAGALKVQKSLSAYSSAPHKISCPHCTRKFPWTSSLRRHLLTHTGQKPFQCGHCPLLFTTKSNCDRHVARKHSGDNAILRGKLSEKVQESQVQLKEEVTEEEDEEEEVAEEEEEEEEEDDDYDGMVNKIGGKEEAVGSSNGGGGSSSAGSGGGASFRCHLCELSSPVRSTILKHIESVHADNFALLDVVGNNSGGGSNEEPADEQQDTNNATNRKVLCAFCIRRFWSVEDLRRHMRSHTGERPFSCQYCSRRFTLKHSMLRHLKKHEGDELNK